MKVFITGGNGFLGLALIKHLKEVNCEVLSSASSSEKALELSQFCDKSFVINLDKELPQKCFDGVDVVIHLAHSTQKKSFDLNVNGTIKIFESAELSGVKRQILCTSYSAYPEAVSEYGKTKYALEGYFRKKNHEIIRPGLIVGPGGLSKKIVDTCLRWPIIPLPGGGKNEIPVVSLDDICECIKIIIFKPIQECKNFHYHYEKNVMLCDFVKEIFAVAVKWGVIFPIPVNLMLFMIHISRLVGIKLPIDESNLKGYNSNRQIRFESHLKEYLENPKDLSEMVKRYFPFSKV
jgi:nucleoside-diphosphate-sugar epimerase